MMTDSDSGNASGSLQFFPVDIGVYLHHDRLETEPEVAAIAALLEPFGARRDVWTVPAEERGADAVSRRLEEWSASDVTGDTFLYWVGHGWSNGGSTTLLAHALSPAELMQSGIGPEGLLQSLKARQCQIGAGWAIVIIDACSSSDFVNRMQSKALDDGEARNYLLVATAAEGSTTLGAFRRVLTTVLTGTFRTKNTISFYEFVGELQRNLNGCAIQMRLDDGSAALHRTFPTPAGRMQASLDTVTDIEKVLANLTDDERRHFVPKASGAELGEQSWYFEGREDERRQILSWLDSADEGMLVVTGAAGSGKSALLGHVVVHSRRELADILMAHGNLAPLPLGTLPPYDVFDLVLHLTGATPRTVVERIAESAELGTPPDTVISEQCAWLVERFRKVDRRAGGQPLGGADVRFTLLADALDEAHLPLLIAQQILSPLADLPGIRVVVGTRESTSEGPDLPVPEDADLMAALGVDGKGNREKLSVRRDPAAVCEYIRNRLHRANARLRADSTQIDRTAKALSDLDQQFLYARLAVHEVISNPELAADPTPLLACDHRQLFARAVERLTAQAPCNRLLLEALALAQGRGLPIADGVWAGIASALADRPDVVVTDDDITELTSTAAPYLMLDTESGQSVYRLAHRTFAEHFTRTVPLPSHDDRHRRITEYLAALPSSSEPDRRPNPYVVHHLPTHAGLAGPDGWQLLADRPQLLDRLSPSAIVASVMLRALGRFELPPAVAGVLFAWEQLTTADPRDRRGLRELATLRCTPETVVQRFGRRSYDPDAAWSVAWGQLKRHAPHLRLTGHTGSVQALVAFTDASRRVLLASGSDDGTVLIWDPARGEAVGDPVALHEGAIQSITEFPGPAGRTLLATGGADGTVRIWDPIRGDTVGEPLTGHDDWVHSVAAFEDDDERTLLATGGGDGTLRVWEPLTGKELAVGGLDEYETYWDPAKKQETERLVEIVGHDGDVYSVVAFVGMDGQDKQVLLATAGNDETIRIWDPTTGEETIDPLTGHDGAVFSVVAFAGREGQMLLASGGEDGTVRIWNPHTGSQTMAPLTGHEGPILAVGALVEETEAGTRTLLVTVGGDNNLRLWDPAGGERETAPLRGHENWVRAVSSVPPLSGAHPLLATGGDDCTLRIWAPYDSRAAGVLVDDAVTTTRTLTSFSGEEEQTLLAAVDATAMLRVFDPAEGEQVDRFQIEHDGDVLTMTAIRVVQDEEERLVFATGGEDDVVRLWDPETGEETGEVVTDHVGGVRALSAFVGFGGRTFLATGGEDGVVRLWDPDTSARTGEVVTDHAGGIRALSAFVGLGGQPILATAGADGVVRRWNLMTGHAVGEPIAHPGLTTVESYRLPDREVMLVTGGDDGTVRLWNCETGAEALRIPLGLPVHDLAVVDGDLVLATEEGPVQVSLEAPSNLMGES